MSVPQTAQASTLISAPPGGHRGLGKSISARFFGLFSTAAFIVRSWILLLGKLNYHQYPVNLTDQLLLRESIKPGQKAGSAHAHPLFDITLGIDLQPGNL